MRGALYNEIDPYAAQWLRNLIAAGHIAPGVVDTRSICDLTPADVAGFTQVHFFAGIGGWSLAARLAGWPDTRPLWTGSCPCQPFSVAGAGAGQADARHLWPEFYRLIAAGRPDVVMGEQVAAAVGKSWLDGVCSDLEGIGYTTGAAVVPACAVDAPHRRDRLWFVADNGAGRRIGPLGRQGEQPGRTETIGAGDSDGSPLAHAHEQGLERRVTLSERGDQRSLGSHGVADADGLRREIDSDTGGRTDGSGSGQITGLGGPRNGHACDLSDAQRFHGDRTGHGASDVGGQRSEPTSLCRREGFWQSSELAIGADGKARRVKPGVRLLAHGIPARVGKLRAFGNAIVPQVAAEIIGAYLDCATVPG